MREPPLTISRSSCTDDVIAQSPHHYQGTRPGFSLLAGNCLCSHFLLKTGCIYSSAVHLCCLICQGFKYIVYVWTYFWLYRENEGCCDCWETEQFVHQACNMFDFGTIFINMLYFKWVISLPVWKRGYKDMLKSSCLVKNMASVAQGRKSITDRTVELEPFVKTWEGSRCRGTRLNGARLILN